MCTPCYACHLIDDAGGFVTTTAWEQNQHNLYTSQYGGTSSANPILAGCAAFVQSVARAKGLGNLPPKRLRQILYDSGVDIPISTNENIGRQPDLVKAVQILDSMTTTITSTVVMTSVKGNGVDSQKVSATITTTVASSSAKRDNVLPITVLGNGASQDERNTTGESGETGNSNALLITVGAVGCIGLLSTAAVAMYRYHYNKGNSKQFTTMDGDFEGNDSDEANYSVSREIATSLSEEFYA